MKKPSTKDRAMVAMLDTKMAPALSTTPLPSTTTSVQPKPKTGPGVMVAFLEKGSEVFQENQQMKQELKAFEGSSPTKKLDPTHVSASRWANRHEDSFLNSEFEQLKAEIENAGGNIQPIKVRPIAGTDKLHYEIVFGHRRHRACLELGIEVLALVESIDDKAVFEEMDRENRQRADLRPYEQGMMYRRALDEGLYPSLRKLSKSIGVEPSNVSTAIKITQLPEVILDAFPTRLDIQYRWGPLLEKALEKDQDIVIAHAKAVSAARLAGEKISSAEVLTRITQVQKHGTPSDDWVIKVKGRAVATVKKSKGRYVVEFEKGALSSEKAAQLEAVISGFLS